MHIYDVTVTLREDMPFYPGDARFSRHFLSTMRAGQACNVSELALSSHTGTHVDAPWHMRDDGPRLDEVPLSVFVGPAAVVEIADPHAVRRRELEPLNWCGVQRVLFKTANSGKLENVDHFVSDFVYIAPDAAQFLAEQDLLVVGLDYLSIDPPGGNGHPAHQALMAAGVVLLEGLDLSDVPQGSYELICCPLKVAGADGAPARVLLRSRP